MSPYRTAPETTRTITPVPVPWRYLDRGRYIPWPLMYLKLAHYTRWPWLRQVVGGQWALASMAQDWDGERIPSISHGLWLPVNNCVHPKHECTCEVWD